VCTTHRQLYVYISLQTRLVLFCFAISALSAITSGSTDVCQNSFLDTFPFFEGATPLRYKAQQMAFLIEFSRFMNQRAPMMLKVQKNHIH
jgi:hypothetical protein